MLGVALTVVCLMVAMSFSPGVRAAVAGSAQAALAAVAELLPRASSAAVAGAAGVLGRPRTCAAGLVVTGVIAAGGAASLVGRPAAAPIPEGQFEVAAVSSVRPDRSTDSHPPRETRITLDRTRSADPPSQPIALVPHPDPSIAVPTDTLPPTPREEISLDPTPSAPRPLEVLYRGRVVSSEKEKGLVPVPHARISFRADTIVRAQAEAESDEDGRVVLHKPTSGWVPAPGEGLIHVESQRYVARVYRLDQLRNGEPITLEPKRRILVVPFHGADTGQPFAAEGRAIRTTLESRLGPHKGEIERVAGVHADDALRRLYTIQEGRARYDPKSVVKFGEQRAESHIVVGWVESAAADTRLACQLVDLKTGETDGSAQVLVARGKSVADAAGDLADQLVKDLCRVTTLIPQDQSEAGRSVRIGGYVRFNPPGSSGWVLWLLVRPDSLAQYYPQLPIRSAVNGMWVANAAIGNDSVESEGKRYYVCPILVSPQRDREFNDYVEASSADPRRNTGFDFRTWKPEEYRLFEGVSVIRSPGRGTASGARR
ncbi:MAG TPA: hypothetical protein VD866_19675 [Urbifossiella sp.]|nr:hypothetical protein [Urbifossiella sp.]